MPRTSSLHLTVLLVSSLLLGACSGGGGSASPAGVDPEATGEPAIDAGSVLEAASAPTGQATGLTFTQPTPTSLRLTWTKGAGSTHTLVVMRAAGPVNAAPVDGTVYVADAVFAAAGASQLGTGNWVVYKGNGTSVTVTGLTSSTVHHVALFAFNQPSTPDYLQAVPARGRRTTLAVQPTGAPSAVTISSITTGSLRLAWSKGDGDRHVVVMRAGAAVQAVPVDGVGYTTSTTFGSGSAIAPGQFVVAQGTGSAATITGLTAGTTYHVAVFGFNGIGSSANYLATAARGSATTLQASTAPQPGDITVAGSGHLRTVSLPFSDPDSSSFTVTWSVAQGSPSLIAVAPTVVTGGNGAYTATTTIAFPMAGTFRVQAVIDDGPHDVSVQSPSFTIAAAAATTINGTVRDGDAATPGLAVALRWTCDADGDGSAEVTDALVATDSTTAGIPAGDAVGGFRFPNLVAPPTQYSVVVPGMP